jgi:hypothetical protein
MSIELDILKGLKQLSPVRKQEVLDFVEFLRKKEVSPSQPRKSLEGLWADTGTSITAEDIDEARREMWGNFPREDIA